MEILKSDNGGEYNSHDFDLYLQQHGVVLELSVPYSQWQNGLAEPCNRSIKEMARSMMLAAHAFTVLYHRFPYEASYKKKPPTEILHPFGCDVYVLVQDLCMFLMQLHELAGC